MPLNLRSRTKRLFAYDGEDIRQLTKQPYENVAQFIGSGLPMYTEIVSLGLALSLLIGLVVEKVARFALTFQLPDVVPVWGSVPFVPTFIVTGIVIFATAFVFGEAMSSPEEDLVDNARRGTWYLLAAAAIYGAYGINDAILTAGIGTAGLLLFVAFLSLTREGMR